MAGSLPKTSEEFSKIPGAKIAIIASRWHSYCVDRMVERAVFELEKLDVAADIPIHRLPGSLELPLAAQLLFEQDDSLDAILAFGVVLQGATSHNASVLHNVVTGFAQVSSRFGKPIVNEVIGVQDMKDAEKRSGDDTWNKGLEAVFAVSEFLSWRRTLESA